jgi:SAM-dependent methyltransferase
MTKLRTVFEDIYKSNFWADDESVSGSGSCLDRTQEVREKLPVLLQRLGASSMLDAGCGDWNWMSQVGFDPSLRIHACDIVTGMVKANAKRYKRAQFFQADITQDILPIVDVIVCRTVLFHLSFENVWKALRNFRASGSTYLLATTHPYHPINVDILDGDWRRLNLQAAPFSLPWPAETFADGPGDDGFLALWKLEAIL